MRPDDSTSAQFKYIDKRLHKQTKCAKFAGNVRRIGANPERGCHETRPRPTDSVIDTPANGKIDACVSLGTAAVDGQPSAEGFVRADFGPATPSARFNLVPTPSASSSPVCWRQDVVGCFTGCPRQDHAARWNAVDGCCSDVVNSDDVKLPLSLLRDGIGGSGGGGSRLESLTLIVSRLCLVDVSLVYGGLRRGLGPQQHGHGLGSVFD